MSQRSYIHLQQNSTYNNTIIIAPEWTNPLATIIQPVIQDNYTRDIVGITLYNDIVCGLIVISTCSLPYRPW